MHAITDFMSKDHRACDALLAAVEEAVASGAWALAKTAFERFQDAMLCHFAAEESLLFPRFEQSTGMLRGPTQVMRAEHAQMRQLLTAAGTALTEVDSDDYAGNSETLLIMMQQHNVKEENLLYPMCDRHLAEQVDVLLAELQQQIDGETGVDRVEQPARVIDARDLEPPEPMVRTMEALDQLGPQQQLLVLLPREPYPLYRALEINGFSWRTKNRPDGTVEVLIEHAQK